MSSTFDRLAGAAVGLAEAGRLPDTVISNGIRSLLRSRLRSLSEASSAGLASADAALAVSTEAANRQHYEVPPEFFRLVLGRHLKYSCCLWAPGTSSLDEAEREMLALTAQRAALAPGQRVLDLGCGWGSLTLFAAAAYPDSRFLAVSNAPAQIEFVRRTALERGLANVEARVADVNAFAPAERFDRIVSVEMMEHVRDHGELMRRLAGWIEPNGRLFVHVFCHRTHAYPFEAEGPGDWMARQFFTGGVMPSRLTIPRAADGYFEPEDEWTVPGGHYARTAEAWLRNLDGRRGDAVSVLAEAGEPDPALAARRWRLFFLAVRETFAFGGGSEWAVGHYRLRPTVTSG